ncbi:DUF2726 domain-containing protein [Halomonas sp. A40-4]|uniref:DUF2726 domain-containing protein n=1 Tax=Halomonas sp. A40-4 TaxID=2785909 RepID=UPI0018F029A4|nr:DUF2726 domain-containing protein [Halomonas sp. A40-4]
MLEKIYGAEYYVFAQVRVAGVIKQNVKRFFLKIRKYPALFRQISQWHFDYLLFHKKDFRIHCAIEVDYHSHTRSILNDFCEDVALNLKSMLI